MDVLTTVNDLRQWRAGRRHQRIGLVPTMGALHAGHLAHLGHLHADMAATVVSIFVNPTQFGPQEDFARYPRTLDVDLAKCEAAGAAAVFAPEAAEMYPPGVPAAEVTVPSVAADLEGALRPGHFAGVCRVVLKLLNLVQPDAATFGRKDFQQLAVLSALVDDLMLPVEIRPVPTLREDDGLAMSSRNRYLDDTTRRHALGLSKALRLAHQLAHTGEADPAVLEAAMRKTMEAHQVTVDYAAVRQARTLAPVDHVQPGLTVALVAGRVGGEGSPTLRLIDNTPLDDEAF